ncbi:MAG: hypothetical protein LBN71_02040 [Tannerella sp.]|jgi:hypothetical protein|nr:hypothetical protein [Tannerella sp.]
MKYEYGNDPAKIERYKKFWSRESVERPLVGFSFKSWFPLDEFKASASWAKDAPLTPNMVIPEDFLEDQEALLREGETIDDDILRGACPAQMLMWGDGMLGSAMKVLPGNVVAEYMNLSWEEMENIHFDRNAPWFRKYIEFIDVLVKHAAGRYPVSHGMLNGPVDYLVTLRGHEQAVFDLMLEPEPTHVFLEKMGDFFIDVTKEAWKRIPLFHGGYFDAQYSLWAPEPITRLQEDALASLSPDIYRDFIKNIDERIGSHFGSAFMHLHSTSMMALDEILDIPTLKCFEVNNDVGGPPVATMIPYFQQIQNAHKSMLIRGSFTPDELRLVMDSLDPEGLYLYIMISDKKEIDVLRPIVGMY